MYENTWSMLQSDRVKEKQDIRLLWLPFHQIVLWVWIYLCLSVVTWWNSVISLNFEKPENFPVSAKNTSYWSHMYAVKMLLIGLFFFRFVVVENLQSDFFTSGNMVPICLRSAYFYGHGKILFWFYWSILYKQLVTLLCDAGFSNLSTGSKADISLNRCKNVSKIFT